MNYVRCETAVLRGGLNQCDCGGGVIYHEQADKRFLVIDTTCGDNYTVPEQELDGTLRHAIEAISCNVRDEVLDWAQKATVGSTFTRCNATVVRLLDA